MSVFDTVNPARGPTSLKLIIQIPCYNEAETLPIALAELPREIPGIDVVEWLVIDDGSTDGTADIARANGVDYVVAHNENRGLARAFMTGLDSALEFGADIIVNTDADNQHCSADIPALVAPIVAGTADIVVGARPIVDIDYYSPVKKALQRLGSWVVRVASNTDIPDAPSGFRAMSRDAAMRLNVFNDYTYTIETIIQAGQKGMAITSVPVRVNPELRPSRLIKSTGSYVWRSLITIIRIFVTYKPLRSFMLPGLAVFSLGILVGLRYLWHYTQGVGGSHIQSLLLAAVLLLAGFQLGLFGFIAEIMGNNRKLSEDIQWRVRRLEIDSRTRTPGNGE